MQPSRWIRKRFRTATPTEGDRLASLAGRALGILDPEERTAFLEGEIRESFGFRRVSILVRPEGSERFSTASTRIRDVLTRVLGILDGVGRPFLDRTAARAIRTTAVLDLLDATHVFRIGAGGARLGLLVVDSSPDESLGREIESRLNDLCGQLGAILENSMLLKRKMELERRLQQQAATVQLGEMAARIAHEIKNPLSSIKTIMQVLGEDAHLAARYDRDLGLVVREIDRLEHSVSQLLGFARPAPSDELVHVRDAADATVQVLQAELGRSGSTLVNTIPAALPAVRGNMAVFREIFMNLILNAVEASGGSARIVLDGAEERLEEPREHLVAVTVADDGPGIPADLHEKVFAPFFTTKQRGTGLGLAIVRRHVESLGGDVRLESPLASGRGTRWVMRFPAASGQHS